MYCTDCEICGPGMCFSGTGATACTACPPMHSSAPGSTRSEACYPFVRNMCAGNTHSTADVLCPAGYALTSSANQVAGNNTQSCCTPCEAGTYMYAPIMPDPCSSTANASSGDTIGVSGGYLANSECSWHIGCGMGRVQLDFARFYTEATNDVVEGLERVNASTTQLPTCGNTDLLSDPHTRTATTLTWPPLSRQPHWHAHTTYIYCG